MSPALQPEAPNGHNTRKHGEVLKFVGRAHTYAGVLSTLPVGAPTPPAEVSLFLSGESLHDHCLQNSQNSKNNLSRNNKFYFHVGLIPEAHEGLRSFLMVCIQENE